MIRYFAFVTMAIGAIATGSAQTPSFSSAVESVRIDVLVVQSGKPVRGLGPGDFEVRDNGVLQTVDLVSDEEIPLNVVMALDMSASLSAKQLEYLRGAGRTLVEGLREIDRAALVTFSHLVSQATPLTSDFDRVRAALDKVSASGQTNLVDATFTAMMIGESDSDARS
jgi:Mg-chelatase subunit ChlD